MRPEDRARISHMIEAAEALADFVSHRNDADLDTDRMLLSALVRAIEVFGEAAAKVSPETRAATAHIPWTEIVAMRNRLIHGYFEVTGRSSGRQRPRKSLSFCRYFEDWSAIDQAGA